MAHESHTGRVWSGDIAFKPACQDLVDRECVIYPDLGDLFFHLRDLFLFSHALPLPNLRFHVFQGCSPVPNPDASTACPKRHVSVHCASYMYRYRKTGYKNPTPYAISVRRSQSAALGSIGRPTFSCLPTRYRPPMRHQQSSAPSRSLACATHVPLFASLQLESGALPQNH